MLSTLHESDFDELWLFALDEGDGLTAADCSGITRFRLRGGGILSTRDHQDMGSSLCALAGVGAAHHFQRKNPELDGERRAPDDEETPAISWPNYHSGRNGDFQMVTVVEPLHELVRAGSPAGSIEFFPAHPHEGAVDAPPGDASARVIAKGRSQTTGREFNLVVAFERSVDGRGSRLGRAVAESSFHHFADYNWDPALGSSREEDLRHGWPQLLMQFLPGHQLARLLEERDQDLKGLLLDVYLPSGSMQLA